MESTSKNDNKISTVTQKMLSTLGFKDSYRQIFPKDDKTMSFYYSQPAPGASRLDRIYHANLEISSVGYVPCSISDHMALICSYLIPEDKVSRLPKNKSYQKISEEVSTDKIFNIRLKRCVDSIMTNREDKDMGTND